MDLAIGAKNVFVMMTLFDKNGCSKLVPSCTYPLTGVGCVSRVYTDHAIFLTGPEGAMVVETFGVSLYVLRSRVDVPLLGMSPAPAGPAADEVPGRTSMGVP